MKNANFKKSLSILLSVIMLITTCAISFSVFAADEENTVVTVDDWTKFMLENDTINMVADILTTLDVNDYVTSTTITQTATPYLNSRGYTVTDYDTYLVLVEWMNMTNAVVDYLLENETYDPDEISTSDTDKGVYGVWNTYSIRLYLAQALSEALYGNGDADADGTAACDKAYYTTTCKGCLNTISIGANHASYNPTSKYISSAPTYDYSYVGIVATTTDMSGYLAAVEAGTAQGLTYSYFAYSTAISSDSGYIMELDTLTVGEGVDILPDLFTSYSSATSFLETTNAVTSYTGSCGESAYFVFEPSTGTLTIYGEGAMTDYESTTYTSAPWYSYASSIKSVVIEDGITTIGAYSFYSSSATTDYTSLAYLSIGNTVTSIGQAAFYYAEFTVVAIPEGVTSIVNGAFRNCTISTIYLPSTLKSIGSNSFGGVSIDTVYYPESEDYYKSTLTINVTGNPALNGGTSSVSAATFVYNHVCSGGILVGTTEATCEVQGTAIYDGTCTTCGLNNYTLKTGYADHTYATDLTTDDATYTDPTCTENGYWTIYCTVCEDETTKEVVEDTASAKGHTYPTVAALLADDSTYTYTAPNCGNDGYWSNVVCTVCSDVSSATTIVNENSANGSHNYEFQSETDSTCSVQGYKEYKCSICETISYEYKDLVDHNYDTTTTTGTYVASNCGSDGYTYWTCTYEGCDEVYKVYSTDDLASQWSHDYVATGNSQASTCSAQGYIEYECASCGDIKTELLDYSGHVYMLYVGVTQEATCQSNAVYTLQCTSCEATSDIEQIDSRTSCADADGDSFCDTCGMIVEESFWDKLIRFFLEFFEVIASWFS